MHPIVRRFSGRRPRVFGLFMLAVGVALAFLGRRVAAAGIAFLVLVLAAGYSVAGIYYLAVGSHAHFGDLGFEQRFVAARRLSARQVFTVIALGFGFLCITGVLYWLLR